MKIWKMGSVVLTAAALASCGGGGDVAGDVATFTVIPPGITYSTVCPGGVAGEVTHHIINGGTPPFRIAATVDGLEVGLSDGVNFIPAPAGSFVGPYLVIDGKDPLFAIRTTLGCDSDLSVTVLDWFSNTASVSIKVEEAD